MNLLFMAIACSLTCLSCGSWLSETFSRLGDDLKETYDEHKEEIDSLTDVVKDAFIQAEDNVQKISSEAESKKEQIVSKMSDHVRQAVNQFKKLSSNVPTKTKDLTQKWIKLVQDIVPGREAAVLENGNAKPSEMQHPKMNPKFVKDWKIKVAKIVEDIVSQAKVKISNAKGSLVDTVATASDTSEESSLAIKPEEMLKQLKSSDASKEVQKLLKETEEKAENARESAKKLTITLLKKSADDIENRSPEEELEARDLLKTYITKPHSESAHPLRKLLKVLNYERAQPKDNLNKPMTWGDLIEEDLIAGAEEQEAMEELEGGDDEDKISAPNPSPTLDVAASDALRQGTSGKRAEPSRETDVDRETESVQKLPAQGDKAEAEKKWEEALMKETSALLKKLEPADAFVLPEKAVVENLETDSSDEDEAYEEEEDRGGVSNVNIFDDGEKASGRDHAATTPTPPPDATPSKTDPPAGSHKKDEIAWNKAAKLALVKLAKSKKADSSNQKVTMIVKNSKDTEKKDEESVDDPFKEYENEYQAELDADVSERNEKMPKVSGHVGKAEPKKKSDDLKFATDLAAEEGQWFGMKKVLLGKLQRLATNKNVMKDFWQDDKDE